MTRNKRHFRHTNAIRQIIFLSLFAVITAWGTSASAANYSNEIIEDKTSQFESIVTAHAGTDDGSTDSLAEMIRQQRATLDAAANEEFGNKESNGAVNGLSECDRGLRTCMQEKCGKDYLQCAGDGDTDWGDKLEACKRKSKCNAHEYAMFVPEIKADRDMNLRLESYQKIIDCGNKYNSCIETECGANLTKCLGKKHGDEAIANCEKIAKECVEQDSGLASRTMNVFATLRQDAEKQIQKDEKRLYELREKMSNQCKRLGAMLDERSLVCVFTLEFWAGDKNTLYASKKAYAGSTFDCNQEWFGVDITTFKENAYRYTRSTTSATSAFMGAGVGMAAGAISSGAINRAIDRSKAQKALKKAEKEDKKSEKKTDKESKKDPKETESDTNNDNDNEETEANETAVSPTEPSDNDTTDKQKAEIKEHNDIIKDEMKTSLSDKGDVQAQAESISKVHKETTAMESAAGIKMDIPEKTSPNTNVKMDFGKITPVSGSGSSSSDSDSSGGGSGSSSSSSSSSSGSGGGSSSGGSSSADRASK